MKKPWRLRILSYWDSFHDLKWRPYCWAAGHIPLYKMDLRGSALCRRCHKPMR